MKTVKFRIWNGMEMVYDITTGKFGTFYVSPEKGDGLNPEDTASLTVNTTKYHEGTPLMQFTGLQDKNGNDIYEGDILKADSWAFNWTVQFDKSKARFNCIINNSGNQNDFIPTNQVSVIGNIYNNPELIDGLS